MYRRKEGGILVNRITHDIQKPDNTLLGGVKSIYLLPFVRYSRSQMTIIGQKLTAFPGSDIYKVYSIGANFTDTPEEEGGAVFFNQNFTFDVLKTTESSQIYTLLKQKYRAIVQDNNGNWRMLGLFNGLNTKYTNGTGTGLSDFSGYKVTMEGKEDRQAIYMNGLTSGMTPTGVDNFVFQGGDNFVFQGGNNYIFN